MRNIRRIKGRIVLVALMLMGYAAFGQDDTTQQVEATFRVRHAFDKANGVSFARLCGKEYDRREIFASKSGDAYLYYEVGKKDNGTWDSVAVTADTTDILAMRQIITKKFVDSLQLGYSSSYAYCGYFLYINENGTAISVVALDNDVMKKYKALNSKLQPLIKILDRVYKKYKN